jgi:hypothetical protein
MSFTKVWSAKISRTYSWGGLCSMVGSGFAPLSTTVPADSGTLKTLSGLLHTGLLSNHGYGEFACIERTLQYCWRTYPFSCQSVVFRKAARNPQGSLPSSAIRCITSLQPPIPLGIVPRHSSHPSSRGWMRSTFESLTPKLCCRRALETSREVN